MVHVPTRATIYIDAAGTEETRTIMRSELVDINKGLTTFATHDWIRIFTDSLSSIQAILRHNTNSGIRNSLYYHYHRLLLKSITDLLETRRMSVFHTTLHKLRAHTNIRENDLANASAKLAVRNFDTPPPVQTTRVDIGEIPPA